MSDPQRPQWKVLSSQEEEAVRTAAQSLRDQGLASFQRLQQGGPLWEAIAAALDRGARDGSFDRPRRGYVRALLPDARNYSLEIWRLCPLAALNHEAVDEQQALRAAAELARESHGLELERLREDGGSRAASARRSTRPRGQERSKERGVESPNRRPAGPDRRRMATRRRKVKISRGIPRSSSGIPSPSSGIPPS